MASAWLVSAGKIAHQPTSESCMVAGRATDVCNSDRIRRGKEEEWVIAVELLIACVPDDESLTLECREVIYAGEEKRVELLGGVGSWDKTSRQNIPLLVAVAWSKIINNPNINPAVRLLVSIKLGPISGEHQNGVMWFEMRCNVDQIILALGVVGEDVR